MSKIGRNQPCTCGSGRKYKRCCLRRGQSELPPPETVTPLAPEPALFEYEARVVGAERVRELLGFDPDEEQATLRYFEVVEVAPGFGLWVAEFDEHDFRGEPIWIADEEASYVFDPGNFFGRLMRPDDALTIPPVWEGCSECQARIDAGRKASGALALS